MELLNMGAAALGISILKLFFIPLFFAFVINYFDMKLWHKVALGLILGIAYGAINGPDAAYIKPVGDLFLNAIRMIIVPLIFFSLISGITNVNDPSALGRIGIKACMAYLATTTFAVITGLTLANLIEPGIGSNLNLSTTAISSESARAAEDFSLIKLFIGIIPTNAIAAMAEGNIIQVVFFAIFTGITILKMKHLSKRLIDIFQMLSKLIFQMVSIIIEFSPYGALTLTGWVVGTQGADVLNDLLKLVMAILVGMVLQYLFFGVFIYVFGKISPLPFYRKSFEYQALALSTSSSKATLATTMKVCRERLGISNTSTSFVLPLGAAMNMDGMAIRLGMCAIFFAQVAEIDLSIYDYAVIILTATLGSIGGAGIPGATIIMLPMVLTAAHIPIEGVALIAGIDRILDMVSTTINITGDATVTLIIDKNEGELDEDTYYS